MAIFHLTLCKSKTFLRRFSHLCGALRLSDCQRLKGISHEEENSKSSYIPMLHSLAAGSKVHESCSQVRNEWCRPARPAHLEGLTQPSHGPDQARVLFPGCPRYEYARESRLVACAACMKDDDDDSRFEQPRHASPVGQSLCIGVFIGCRLLQRRGTRRLSFASLTRARRTINGLSILQARRTRLNSIPR